MPASPKDCRALLDRVPGLGLIFDTGNFRVDDPGSDELAAYESLKDRMLRVHVKDGDTERSETPWENPRLWRLQLDAPTDQGSEPICRRLRPGGSLCIQPQFWPSSF